MKNIVSIVAAVLFFSCANTEKKVSEQANTVTTDTANYTTIRWIDSVENIGVVKKGEVAEIKFRFKNTGEKPLFIISARPGCGCTVADYPKEAILPDSEGVIVANYDSNRGTIGDFRKSISVHTNTRNGDLHYVFFHGVVKDEGDSTATEKKEKETAEAKTFKN